MCPVSDTTCTAIFFNHPPHACATTRDGAVETAVSDRGYPTVPRPHSRSDVLTRDVGATAQSRFGAISVGSPNDMIRRWVRELADLRARFLRRGSKAESPSAVAEDALALCDQLLRELGGSQLESETLRGNVQTETDIWERLFEEMPSACLITDSVGIVRAANRSAGALVNVSPRHLVSRELIVFWPDRDAFRGLLQGLARAGSDPIRATLLLRPKERRAFAVDVIVLPLTAGDFTAWVWFLSRSRDSDPSIATIDTAQSDQKIRTAHPEEDGARRSED